MPTVSRLIGQYTVILVFWLFPAAHLDIIRSTNLGAPCWGYDQYTVIGASETAFHSYRFSLSVSANACG